MAVKEYLHRTPTSTGNRHSWTLSFWVKRNAVAANQNSENTSGAFFNFYTTQSSSPYQSVANFNGDGTIQLGRNQSATDHQLNTSNVFRDVGNWMHILAKWDVTKGVAQERLKLYVNGALQDSLSGTYPSLNYDGAVNTKVMHTIGTVIAGGVPYAPSGPSQEYFDYFLVDGQALDADVFGFYKDGDGYVSVGSTQATDFRPGQWSPHSPRKIKSEIERRGGFGVNGFYLPMNDSSNFGADFHCAPDSIIKLKGEDLPQPRNGAPTTSDAYVSELRQETGTLGFDGVVKFDGSGDCLTVSDNVDFEFGSGNFTIEAFIYYIGSPGTGGNTYVIASKWDNQSAPNDKGFILRISDDGSGDNLQWYYTTDGSTNQVTTGSAILSPHRWYHIAFVRNGTTGTFYINGIADTTTVSFGSNSIRDTGNAFRIGANLESGSIDQEFKGFISNLRVVKGTAVYTSNFTSPTEPLANVTNTKLLCCNSSTSATASTVSPGSITANGDAFATRNELSGSTVLAVPGIDTNTNPELVTNGDFSNGTTGWTGLSGGSLSVEDGKLKITETTNAVDAYAVNGTAITTEVGKTYTIKWTFTEGTNTSFTVRFGNSGNQTQEYQSNSATGGSFPHSGSYAYTFTATATQLNLSFIVNQANSYGYLSNVSVKEAVPVRDYSADIKGSGTNRTPTLSKCGVTSPVASYYGSAISTGGAGDDLYYDLDGSGANAYGTGDFTFECWFFAIEEPSNWGILMKHATNGSWNNGITLCSKYNTDRKFTIYTQDGSSNVQTIGTTNYALNQWHHVVAERYNGQLTLYVNGVAEATRADTRNYAVAGTPASSAQYALSIGAQSGGNYQSNGYFQDVRVYKGVAKYKGGFDVPKPYTPVGFEGESWRQVPDTCKNNFATLNGTSIPSKYRVSEGNLRFTNSTTNWTGFIEGTVGFSTGKWYWETRADVDTDYHHIGIIGVGITHHNSTDTYRYAMSYQSDGRFYAEDNNTTTFATNKTHANLGDIVQVAVDMNDKKMWIGINGNWIDGGDPATGTTENFNATVGFGYQHYVPFYDSYGSSGLSINFGQNPTFGGKRTAGTNTDDNGKGLFSYDVPAGYLSLCEDNLPTPTIADPGEHFKCVLYEGDNASTHSISGVGFQPDLVWLKQRTGTTSNNLTDSVRGIGYTLFSDDAGADNTNTNRLQSFDRNGFTVGANGAVNQSGSPFVAWCWKAGGAAVSNTSGSVTSQVSVNQDAGFSIVSWTSNGSSLTVGHGLNKVPAFILQKQRDASANWTVYHKDLAATEIVKLNTNGGKETSSDFANTSPTSSVLSSFTTGISGNKVIAYCWAEIEGYSKFGSYVGNGSTDGPFVYCGFKPAWVMVKCSSAGGRNWRIWDSSRGSTNPTNLDLLANTSDAENSYSSDEIDLLSNGFKIRSTGSWHNTSGETYIFMAFAESPFQTANAK